MGGIANHWKELQVKGSVQSPVPVAGNSQLGLLRLPLRHHLPSESMRRRKGISNGI